MKAYTKYKLLFCLFLWLAWTGTSQADIPRPCDVCFSGCTYYSIQAAINASSGGDEIEVCDGTYSENLDFLGKAITVISRNGPATTIIDAGRSGSVVTFANGEGTDTTLSGFTLQMGRGTSLGMSYGGGIYVNGASPTIEDCVITDNSSSYGAGIYLSSSSAVITGCTISGNQASVYDGGGLMADSSSPIISGCVFEVNSANRNGAGIFAASSSLAITSTTFHRNWATTHSSGDGGGIYLSSSSANISDCTFSENNAGDDGGGIYCDSASSSVMITDTDFMENEADYQGGGVFCQASSPSITDSTFSDNSAYYGGGLFLISSSGSVSGSTFDGNHANEQGGGIALYGSSASISGCSVTDNTASVAGAGIWVYNGAHPTITDCLIRNNTANGDGGGLHIVQDSDPTIINTIISDNTVLGTTGFGAGGGASVFNSSSPTFMNCTIRRNQSSSSGGGLYSEFSDVIVTNSIFWDDVPTEIDTLGSGEVVVTYSDVEGGYTGVGNINEAPMFVSGSDSHLRIISPCIEGGTLTGAPDHDIDGDIRPNGDLPDIGADEFVGINYPVPEIMINGMGGVVNLSLSEVDEIFYTLALDNHSRTDPADWWIVLATPAGTIFSLTPTGWTTSWEPLYQGPLFNVEPFDMAPMSISDVPIGVYYMYFAVDTVMDGEVTFEELFYDWVMINLTE